MEVEEPWWVRHWRPVALVGGGIVAVGLGVYLWRKIQKTLADAEMYYKLGETTTFLESGDYQSMLQSALRFKNIAKQIADVDRFERISIAYQYIYLASGQSFDFHRAHKHAMKLRRLYEQIKTDSMANKVLTMFAIHDYDLASECFHKATQNEWPNLDECYSAMHLAEMRRRNPEKAVEYLRRSLELAQQGTPLQHAMNESCEIIIAQTLGELGQYDEALSLARHLGGNSEHKGTMILLASIEASMGNIAAGEEILKKLRDTKDDELAYTFYLGALMDFYWQHGMEKKAAKILKKLKRSTEQPPYAHSKWLDTRFFGFLWKDRPEDDTYVDIIYAIALDVKWCIPDSVWIETHFERPQKEADPYFVEMPLVYAELQKRFWGFILIKSPPVVGIKAGGKYLITVKVYSDESKKKLLCIHRQLVANNFPVNKMTKKTAKEIMKADFELE